MASYEANKAYAERYLEKFEAITVRVPKGRKGDVETLARERGMSVTAMVNEMLRQACGQSDEQWRA